jgi:hypothetical protein
MSRTMGIGSEIATSTARAGYRRTGTDSDVSYRLFTDEQLIIERRRLVNQLDELTMNPGSSPVASQILVNMEREIERMTDELRQRALSQHPSSGGMSVLRRFRSMSWPSHAG